MLDKFINAMIDSVIPFTIQFMQKIAFLIIFIGMVGYVYSAVLGSGKELPTVFPVNNGTAK